VQQSPGFDHQLSVHHAPDRGGALAPTAELEPHAPAGHAVVEEDRVVAGLSNDLAWWRCPVGHEWRARVRDRTAASKASPALRW